MPTPITTEAMVDQLFDLWASQGLTFDDLAAAKAAALPIFQNWLGGDNALPAETMRTALNVLGRQNSFVLNQFEFWTLASDGGEFGDGTFNVALPDGTTQRVAALSKLAAGAQITKVFETKAELDEDLQALTGAYAIVYDDATPAFDGVYVKSGGLGAGSWSKVSQPRGVSFQTLAPETGFIAAFVDMAGRAAWMVSLDGTFVPVKIALPSGSVGAAQVAAGALDQTRLSSGVNAILAKAPADLPPESGYLVAFVDPADRIALAILDDGTVIIPKFQLTAASVGLETLAAEVTGLFPQVMSAESGYLFAIVDPVGRIAFAITTAGKVVFGSVEGLLAPGAVEETHLADGAISERTLGPALGRHVLPRLTDVVNVIPDDWRARLADVSVRTEADGTLWARLPPSPTRHIRGLNGSGQGLSFRRSAALPIKGRRYVGAFDPGTLESVRYRGTFSTSAPTASSPITGDYLHFIGATGTTHGAYTYDRGDLAVYNGSAWVRQAAPAAFGGGAYTARQPRDWYVMSDAGTFDGVAYGAGDRIVYVGFQSASGLGYARWTKPAPSESGDLFYRGEFDPAGGLPATPADGEVYQASAAGAAGGFTFAVGDWLIRDGGAWAQLAGEPVQTVASGGLAILPCRACASEWEVRRTDKSATRVGVNLGHLRQSSPRRESDVLVLWSDSMFGVSGVGTSIVSKLSRPGTVFSYGGGTSRDVEAMIEYEIARLGDRYEAALHILWHGQNNQPSTALNAAQVREASLRIAGLIGARDGRCAFMSILGQRAATWNGSRIVSAQFEDAFAGAGHLWALEQWYAQAFPGRWISTRQVLLDAAVGRTQPDPQFPGMTEAEVAETYGIVPWSFFNTTQSVPVPVANLVYQGTKGDAGLPTGGAANDYFLRTGGGTVGNLLINVAGTWTEFSIDVTHLSPAGADALSTGVANLIIANGW